jgi:hypothetical protein
LPALRAPNVTLGHVRCIQTVRRESLDIKGVMRIELVVETVPIISMKHACTVACSAESTQIAKCGRCRNPARWLDVDEKVQCSRPIQLH